MKRKDGEWQLGSGMTQIEREGKGKRLPGCPDEELGRVKGHHRCWSAITAKETNSTSL